MIAKHNLGFIAVVGEQRLRELPHHERAPMKQKHNNFGVGKLICKSRWPNGSSRMDSTYSSFQMSYSWTS
nr:hypothetical protein [Anoxybacillus sp. KU2-6(11)]